jgi:hypothetical protein
MGTYRAMKDRNTGSGDLNLHPQLHTFFISGKSVFLKKLQAAKIRRRKIWTDE